MPGQSRAVTRFERLPRVCGAVAGLASVGLLGLLAAAAFAQGPVGGAETTAPTSTSFPPRPLPIPAQVKLAPRRLPIPATMRASARPAPPPGHRHARSSSARDSSASRWSGVPSATPHRSAATAPSKQRRAARHRPSIHKKAPSRRETGRQPLGSSSPTTSETSLTSTGPRNRSIFLLMVALGLSVSAFALTPRWALERTRVLKPVVEQRPHVFMAGLTIAGLTGFAYLLGHWAP